MAKLWAIAWKELYTTFRDRNLILIMFATPLVLSTIIGLAFGGLGSDTPTIGAITVAVVNLDEGFDLATVFGDTAAGDTTRNAPGEEVSSPVTNTLPLTAMPTDFALNLGDIVASILLGEALTTTGTISDTNLAFDSAVDGAPSCPLMNDSTTADNSTFQGSLAELLNGTRLVGADEARTGVEEGVYAVAVIIPPGYTQTLLPSFGLVDNRDLANRPQIEVYGNSGDALSATIVRSIVSGIVSQFERLPVTLEASIDTLIDNVDLDQLDLNALATTLNDLAAVAESGDFATVRLPISGTGTLTDTFALLGCLFSPGINPISLQQQPLDQLQEGTSFARILVVAGSAQAVFFALFTGVFGILSIYEERKQWTLQRMLVSPTNGDTILLGKLLGNLVVVIAQLLVLMAALTIVASIVLGEPTMIWGNQIGLLLLVVVILSLAVSGVGVLIVGVARTPEQVQIVGPIINMMLGVLGGAFGFPLPDPLPRLSLITWATAAFEKLAGGQSTIGINLLVLAAQGVLFFLIGAWFFRRRMRMG
ncbi:MAG TPA: ABC transporter permease [Caldilineaceae bacterium]|nr:ABC transporter permease [Caldilineaceae bacterium]